MKTFTLMVWLMLPDGSSRLIEAMPVDSQAECINGVADALDRAEKHAASHDLGERWAFDVTCRAGKYEREGESRG